MSFIFNNDAINQIYNEENTHKHANNYNYITNTLLKQNSGLKQTENLQKHRNLLSINTYDGIEFMPVGGIILWGDCNNIPDGWKLCDGTRDTPDFRGKFPIGSNEIYPNLTTGYM